LATLKALPEIKEIANQLQTQMDRTKASPERITRKVDNKENKRNQAKQTVVRT
jgi:hypothetical protein